MSNRSIKRRSILYICILLLLAAGLLPGCGSKTVGIPASPQISSAASEAVGSAPKSPAADVKVPKASASNGPSAQAVSTSAVADYYNDFLEQRDKATNRMFDSMARTDDYVNYVDQSMDEMDAVLELLEIGDKVPAEAGTKTDIKIRGDERSYRIYFQEEGGDSCNQIVTYNKEAGTLTSYLTYIGGVPAGFECVKAGSGYAAQYYYTKDGAKFQRIFLYFDDSNTSAFGLTVLNGMPESILIENSFSEEFVKNDKCYMILKNGKYESHMDNSGS